MSKLFRVIAARLRFVVGERRRFPRHKAQRNVRLILNFSPSETGSAPADESQQSILTLAGQTRNFSETGLAIFVPSLRVGGYDLNIIGRSLKIDVDIPNGPVHITAVAVRCQRLGDKGDKGERGGKGDARGFVIGVRITEMNDKEWVRLVRYIRTLKTQS